MLKWIGNKKGAEGIIGIPARDLNDDEVNQFGGEQVLLKTGLYEKPPVVRTSVKPAKPAEEDNE